MKGLSNINLEITSANVGNEVQLFDTSILSGYVTEPFKYNITTYCLVSSLNARIHLPSLPTSDIPNIYPEDSAYQRYAKKRSTLQGSVKLQVFTKHFNGTTLNLGIIEIPNYGGYWTENLLLELLNTQRDSLALGEGTSLWCKCLDSLGGQDSINIFGLASWELSLLPIDPQLTTPNIFGIEVGFIPTLLVPNNPQRYRLHLQNIGASPCWFVYGSNENCIPYQCLYLAPGSSWEEETLRHSIFQAIWAVCEPGNLTNLTVLEQSLLW